MLTVFLVGLLAGFVWLIRESNKLKEKPVTKKPKGKAPHRHIFQNRAAVHEAGHTLAAWCCTLVDTVDSVTIERPEGGHVLYRQNVADTTEGVWCELVITLAGLAAEISEFNVIRSGESESDLQKSLASAKNLASNGSTKSPWGTFSREKTLKFKNMYRDLEPVHEQILAEAYTMCHEIIEAHGNKFYKLVSVLLTKKTISQSDLESVLGNRSFINIVKSPIKLGLFKPGFIIPR
jgi:ATP-dependent Zn protease